MKEHLSTGILERFQRQDLNAGDKREIYDHIAVCDGCRRRIVNAHGGEVLVLQSIVEQLLPDDTEEPYHLEFELIEGYIDGTLNRLDRETAELHLEVCTECSAEVIDLRDSLAVMKAAPPPAITIAEKRLFQERIWSLRNVLQFLYPYRVPIVLALTVLVIVGTVLWRMKSSEREFGNDRVAQQTPTPNWSPTPNAAQARTTPFIHPPSIITKPANVPSHNPRYAISDRRTVVINDGLNHLSMDRSGKLVGLGDVPSETRRAVNDVLLTSAIKKPEVLNDLISTGGALRGDSSEESIKLLYPKFVIAEDRPSFKWLPVKDATSYKVSVGDSNFQPAARSEVLPATVTEWKPERTLKRGVVYTWIVTAMKDGVDVSGESVAPAMKFKVLETEKLNELGQLKDGPESHVALGVFYAREGMVIEAEREFHFLVEQNPRSPVARKVLKEIQSWRQN